jgi:L-amino acid N-acyltransferase YncA
MGGEQVLVRDAEIADLGAVFEIYNHEVVHSVSTFDTELRDPATDEAWLTGREARYPVLVAVRRDELLGWGALSQWSPRGAYARTAEVSVYVDHRHRKEGVGRLLLGALIERAPAGGIAVLLARVTGENPASVALHEGLGFNRIGTQRRSGEKFGQVLDVALLDLHLDER